MYSVIVLCLSLVHICHVHSIYGMDDVPKSKDAESPKNLSPALSPNAKPKIHEQANARHSSKSTTTTTTFNYTHDQIEELKSKVHTHETLLMAMQQTSQAGAQTYVNLQALYSSEHERVQKAEENLDLLTLKIGQLEEMIKEQQELKVKENEKLKKIENQLVLINSSYTAMQRDYSALKKEIADNAKAHEIVAKAQKATDTWCATADTTIKTCITQVGELTQLVHTQATEEQEARETIAGILTALKDKVVPSLAEYKRQISSLEQNQNTLQNNMTQLAQNFTDHVKKTEEQQKEIEEHKKGTMRRILDAVAGSTLLVYGMYQGAPLLSTAFACGSQCFSPQLCATAMQYGYVPAVAIVTGSTLCTLYAWASNNESHKKYATAWHDYFKNTRWFTTRAQPTKTFLYTAAFCKGLVNHCYDLGTSLVGMLLTTTSIDLLLAVGMAAAVARPVIAA